MAKHKRSSQSALDRLTLLAMMIAAVSACTSAPEAAFRVELREPSVLVMPTTDGKDAMPVLHYRHADVEFKPYVEVLRTPAGVNVLRDSPFDHKHHHALMFALAVDGVDFWAETAECGRQVHRDLRVSETDGTIQHGLNWVAPATEAPLCDEQRRLRMLPVPDRDATLITWHTQLTLPPGRDTATITGERYFGLGARFVQSMDTGGRFFNADGGAGVAGTDTSKSAWCAYAAVADGKPVTVAMFGHPANAVHPVDWFTMDDPFAYLCATMAVDETPITLMPGKPLCIRYGVAVWDGHPAPSRIEEAYRWWVAQAR